jgi:hypothetical protein
MIHHLVAASAATTLYGGAAVPADRGDRWARMARPPATAARDGSHHHDGNGRRNRNVISVRSPTRNHGYQHTNNGNAGGMNPVQNALCRNVTVCTINQKVDVVQPERPAPAVRAEPVTVPIETLPQTVIPQTARPPRPVPRSVTPRPTGPYMYLGAEGFLLAAPDSSTPAAFGSSMDRMGFFPLRFGSFG